MGAEVMVESNGALAAERVRREIVLTTVDVGAQSWTLAALLATRLRARFPGDRFTVPENAETGAVTVTCTPGDESNADMPRVYVEAFLAGAALVLDSSPDALLPTTDLTPTQVDALTALAASQKRDREHQGPRNCQGRPAPPRARPGGYVCPSCFADCRATGTT
jgi:hypothetical protein